MHKSQDFEQEQNYITLLKLHKLWDCLTKKLNSSEILYPCHNTLSNKSMKRFIKSLIVIFILFQNCTCFNWKEENMVDKYSVLDSAVLQKCNQIYITDSNVFLMLYDFASPDAYDPFRIDPYLLCYDNNLEVQWCMFVDALKIISIKNDTILLLGRCNTEMNTYSINSFFLNHQCLLKKSNI